VAGVQNSDTDTVSTQKREYREYKSVGVNFHAFLASALGVVGMISFMLWLIYVRGKLTAEFVLSYIELPKSLLAAITLGCVIYDAVSISEVIKYYYCAALIWRA
jgi:hypothetical protein